MAACHTIRGMEHTYRCSGDGPGTHEDCSFATDSLNRAMDHFESTGHSVDDYSPAYAVTIEDPNDPESTRTLAMSENEVRDTYPHWAGRPETLTARDGSIVRIEASL